MKNIKKTILFSLFIISTQLTFTSSSKDREHGYTYFSCGHYESSPTKSRSRSYDPGRDITNSSAQTKSQELNSQQNSSTQNLQQYDAERYAQAKERTDKRAEKQLTEFTQSFYAFEQTVTQNLDQEATAIQGVSNALSQAISRFSKYDKNLKNKESE